MKVLFAQSQSCLNPCDPVVPLSMEFSRQEYCSGLPHAPPGELPAPEIKPESPKKAGRFFTVGATTEVPEKDRQL